MQGDKDKAIRLLKTAKGQIEGIIKMIEDDRYCIDVSNQLMATTSILAKINKDVLKAHIQGCVRAGIEKGGSEADNKINEIMEIINAL